MGDSGNLGFVKPLACVALLLLLASVAVSIISLVFVMSIHDEGCKVDLPTDDHQHATEEPKAQLDTSTCHDIAIVGAGVGGAYSAYKMRNKNLDIAIYEQLDRLGGRAFSVSVPGVGAKAEMGPMRYTTSAKRTVKHIEELGLKTREFTRSKENDRVYNLRGNFFTQPELITKKLPYGLRDDEVGKYPFGLAADLNKKSFGTKNPEPYKTNTTDGTPLWKVGYTAEASRVLSAEAVRYMNDAMHYDDDMTANINADYHWLNLEEGNNPDSNSDYFTLTDGFQNLVEKTVDSFLKASEKHSVHLNHQIKTLELAPSETEKIYMMKVKNMKSTSKETKTVCAKKVILALPTPALKRLYWEDKIKGQRFVDNVDSVLSSEAFKTFFAYDSPWWRTDGNAEAFRNADKVKHVITDLPLRQTLDMEADPEGLAKTGKTLLLATYSTTITSEIYRDMALKELDLHENEIKTDPGQYSNKRTVDFINGHLSTVFNISAENLPQPYAVVSQHWGQELHGAAWHFWRGGYKWNDVVNQIVKPGDNDHIYICGEAFSPEWQAYIEGAFDVCDIMLSKYFDL